jgi:hypothetical protein
MAQMNNEWLVFQVSEGRWFVIPLYVVDEITVASWEPDIVRISTLCGEYCACNGTIHIASSVDAAFRWLADK